MITRCIPKACDALLCVQRLMTRFIVPFEVMMDAARVLGTRGGNLLLVVRSGMMTSSPILAIQGACAVIIVIRVCYAPFAFAVSQYLPCIPAGILRR